MTEYEGFVRRLTFCPIQGREVADTEDAVNSSVRCSPPRPRPDRRFACTAKWLTAQQLEAVDETNSHIRFVLPGKMVKPNFRVTAWRFYDESRVKGHRI